MQPGSSFDFSKLRQEAKNRWLKNSEVLFILQGHENLPIEEETPEKPISGSLFLFNRKILRFFRKDGHMWRKKKDGRAVGEAHERLKVGNVDALNCYYARGDKNHYFQRRIYWMLDPAYDHIVLVHYREVPEGRFFSSTYSQQAQDQLSSKNGNSSANNIQFPSATSEVYDSYQASSCSPPISGEANSMNVEKDVDTVFNISSSSDPSSQPDVNQALRDLEEQLSLDKCDDNVLVDVLPAHTNDPEILEAPAFLDSEIENSFQKLLENLTPEIEYTACDQVVNENPKSLPVILNHDWRSFPWNDMLELSSYSTELSAHGRASSSTAHADGFEPSYSKTSASETYHCIVNELKHGTQFSSEENIFDAQNYAEHQADGRDKNSQLSAARSFFIGSDSLWSPDFVPDLAAGDLYNAPGTTGVGPNSNAASAQKENGVDYMSTIDIHDRNNAYSSDLLELYSDQGQHGTSLAPEPCLTVAKKLLFRICDFSPEWSFSFERAKVIITGEFQCNPSAHSWAVMFGEVQVPAKIIQEGVLRCQAPEHSTGKVSFCITSGNKESCSEVREYEFRPKSVTSSLETLHLVNETLNPEELLLLVKFVHILLCPSDDSSVAKPSGPRETECCRKFKAAEEQCLQLHEHQAEISFAVVIDGILQELMKDKLQQWLLSKTNAKEGGGCPLSKEEQHIIHMISGLDYEWALKPILDAGVGVNCRDAAGKTALHWAARFGRENMAAALLASGALAGAVTDPTTQDPLGKTAGALASSSGHNGLAGYLSEAELTSHLSSIKGLAAVEEGEAVESISERSALLQVGETEDELSLKDSLAAIRNAAQAAARIHAVFRAHSFTMRRQKDGMHRNEYGMTAEEMHSLTSSTKIQRALHSYQDQNLDRAALSIQKKYRGWKGQKDFLTLRQRVVKIQAQVRGHQARKKYREFLCTVSVLEKLILRWRKGGAGLRGLWHESDIANEREEEEDEDILRVFRKQKVDASLEQAFSRVLSMVESPSARQQYRRMLECYCKVKAEQASDEEPIPRLKDKFELMQDDDFLRRL